MFVHSLSLAFGTSALPLHVSPAESHHYAINRGLFPGQRVSVGRPLFASGSVRLIKGQPRRSLATALLGLPRVFGGRRTAETIQAESVVSVPPTPDPPGLRDPVGWARAHPVRGAIMLVVGFLFIQSTVRRLIKPKKKKKISFVADGLGSDSSKTSTSVTLRRKATPRRHESNEEAMDLIGNKARKYVIVGGKGGVGKTSMSAAVATQLADRGQTTLIISTDPAHSLSDAFDQAVTGGSPVPVLGIDNLYAQEVNPENMKKNFRILADTGSGGIPGLEDMGLDDLNSLFDTLPPGFDEAVALMEIIKFIEGDPEYRKFERIVFDTAPTGHTLRLLALPDFLNGFFGKIISMKSKFGRMMNQFKGMFAGQDVESDLDASMNDIEEMKRSMAVVRDLFRDEVQTEFIVATIPNMMAISESSRLVDELRKEDIPVRHVFVNQVQPQNDDCAFCSARHKEQEANLRYIQEQFKGLRISTVQSFDREIKGGPALRAMGAQLFPSASLEASTSDSKQMNGATNSASLGSVHSHPAPSPVVSTPVEIVE
jgi:arsenite/tail-anchored protein-transporting ATPase